MTIIPMPKPFAGLQYNSGWGLWEQAVPSAIGQPGVVSVFTQEQMEAYASAKVREALEEAAGLCDRFANRMMDAEECADAIRAMIPPLPGLASHHP